VALPEDLRGLVARFRVAHDAHARITREHALEPARGGLGAVRDDDHARWIDAPMPTPPPWCSETQVAPAAVFISALRTGQSAIASLPSLIASVSR
jgi:hypothetical protein